MKNLVFAATEVDGVKVFNATPHTINFGVGDEVKEVPASVAINATPAEEMVSNANGVELVKTVFKGTEEGWAIIKAMHDSCPEAIIVGSIIAAQAYPGDIVALTPCPGFERVPPAEKRMNPHKFTTFA